MTATNLATAVTTSATTNKEGIYSIRFLPVGQYTVSFQASGFTRQITLPLTLEIAQDAKVDAALKVGSTSTSVNVDAGTAPILNTTDGTISTTISETLVNDLPVNGHNFTELSQIMPGSTVADGNQWNGAGQSSRTTPGNVYRASRHFRTSTATGPTRPTSQSTASASSIQVPTSAMGMVLPHITLPPRPCKK